MRLHRHASVRRHFAQRLAPISIIIGVLIGVGFPSAYVAVESAALAHTARILAMQLAEDLGHTIREDPALWEARAPGQLQRFRALHSVEGIMSIEIRTNAGRVIGDLAPPRPDAGVWWNWHTSVGTVPLLVDSQDLGAVSVSMTRAKLLWPLGALFLISLIIGLGLAALSFFLPLRFVDQAGALLDDLLAGLRRSVAETERLNAELEQRVADRTAQLAQREQELQEAKTFLEHLIQASPGVVFRLSLQDASLAYVSHAVERVLGYPTVAAVLTTGAVTEFVHPEDRERVCAGIERSIRRADPQIQVECRVRHQDGNYHWMLAVLVPERDGTGRPVTMLGYALDINERKAIEAAIRQARDEAEQANRAKSDFLSRMSHELRTPMNAILGFSQLLEMGSLDPQQRRSVEHIMRAGRHLLELINEVLDISRIESGRLSISPEAVSVQDVVREVVELTSPMAAHQTISLRCDLSARDTRHVLADRQRLKQALLNLASNAVKYNRPGGDVVFSCETHGRRLRLLVADTGPGIPPDGLHRLFKPFERLHGEQSGIEGTGLGLALSKRVIEAMGGTIGLESRVGEGTTFWVELPIAEQPAQQLDHGIDTPGGPIRTSAGQPATVLYIEDNLSNLELVERVLSLRSGVRLMSAMQGRLGLDLAVEHRPDLILLDLHLPDLPGEEVLIRLRYDPRTRDIPVVMISADATARQRDRLIEIGAREYITKPIDVRRLVAMLDRYIAEAHGTR